MSALAPRLRHRITFQRQVNERDSEGLLQTSWEDVELESGARLVGIPAEVLTGAGREFNASGAVQSELAARITVRWFPGLSSAWRILHDGRVYNIATFEADATGRREWRIRCAAGVNDGS